MKSRLDTLGWIAFVTYVVIGGVFVFGFGRSLTSAVRTQNETPCRSLVPRQAKVSGLVLDEEGKPLAKAELVPIVEGRAQGPVEVRPDGSFTVFLPRRAQRLKARAPGRADLEVEIVVEGTETIDVEFRLAPEQSDEPGTFVETGRATFEAPEFVVADLEGNEVRLSDFRGKLVVLNFWATWCEPCITEWPQLSQLAERLAERDDVVVLAVSVEEDPAAIPPFLKQMALSDTQVKVLWDATTTLHKEFGSENIPDTYLVDEQGRVTDVFINTREWGSPDAFHCIESSIGR